MIDITLSKAAEYYIKEGSFCSAVNRNDYFGKFVIHNAAKSFAKGKFSVSARTLSGDVKDWGTFTSDDSVDKLIITPPENTCISTIQFITIKKAQ